MKIKDIYKLNKKDSNENIKINKMISNIPENEFVAKEILEITEKKLLTPYGLRTLAKGEKGYREKDRSQRTESDHGKYHDGHNVHSTVGRDDQGMPDHKRCCVGKGKTALSAGR